MNRRNMSEDSVARNLWRLERTADRESAYRRRATQMSVVPNGIGTDAFTNAASARATA